MHRRPIIHVFLALLLLFTQQIGATHVYSHWIATQQSALNANANAGANPTWSDEDDSEQRKRIAIDAVCAECLSVAQMAAAITTPAITLAIVDAGGVAVAVPVTASICERTECVFQSRAPPLA